jgi:hypothetical protein
VRTLVLLVAFVMLCAVLVAQGTQVAQISGRVLDDTGLGVPAAQITIMNTGTGITRTAVSGPDGAYIVSNLPVGSYRLQVTKEGFTAYVQSGIVLQVNTNPEINVTIKVGSVS